MDNQTLNVRPKSGYGFIYCYTSPSGKKYIGQTRTTLKERAKLNAKGYKGCSAFYRTIQKYGWDNFSVEILDEVPLDVLNESEIQYILYYDTVNKEKGYNIMQEKYEYLASLKRIPVYSYDKNSGEFLERYESIAAAERAMNVHYGTIRRVLNLPNKHVRNRLWKTEKIEKAEIIKNNIQPHSIKVYMYDSKSGNFLQEFSSIREAAKLTGYNRCTIQEHVSRKNVKKGRKHTFKNYKVENLYNGSSTTIPIMEVDSSESKEEQC